MLKALFAMMSPRLWGAAAILFLVAIGVTLAHADDGIPDNCEYSGAAYYQPNIFPRYEPQNQRLVLVDWTTGADVTEVAESLVSTRILGWSIDCRYLAGAVGTSESMDTIVWDVVGGGEIGRVRDAHGQPHYITWGPNDYLVVETRNGAVLWNVPANTQVTLTTSFDTFTARNFSRLRWDAEHNQLIVNLAAGNRVVYDLTTGQEIPVASNVTDSVPGNGKNTVIIGGKPYQCEDYYRYGYRHWFSDDGPAFVSARYNVSSGSVYLALFDIYGNEEVISILEEGVKTSAFVPRGWSEDCRYLAASLGKLGIDASDTVVWDIVERRRVGTFEDAREILHPIHWVGESLVVETRNGAYLWHLPTNTRTLITDVVEIPLAGRSNVRNFESLEWDADRNLFFIVPLGGGTPIAYDAHTGQQVVADPPQKTLVASQNPVIAQIPVTATPIEGQSGDSPWRSSYSYYTKCGNLETHYDEETRQTTVIESQTQTTLSVLEGFGKFIGWSPDCRTIAGIARLLDREGTPYDNAPLDDMGQDWLSYIIVFWDAATGARLQEFLSPYRNGECSKVFWSPGGDRAVICTTNGYYIYQPASGHTALLVFTIEPEASGQGGIADSGRVYWDYERGQILIGGVGAVFAFDMQTGVQRYRFTANAYSTCYYWACYFGVAPNNKTLYVSDRVSSTTWNLDTLEFQHFDD